MCSKICCLILARTNELRIGIHLGPLKLGHGICQLRCYRYDKEYYHQLGLLSTMVDLLVLPIISEKIHFESD